MPVPCPCPSQSPFKVLHYVNGDGVFDEQNGSETHSDTIKMFTINTMLNFDIDYDRGGNGDKNRS